MKAWDGECVVYDQRTGDTHHLDHRATAVFGHLVHSGPGSLDDLAGSLTPDMTTAVLTDLERMGLVEPVA